MYENNVTRIEELTKQQNAAAYEYVEPIYSENVLPASAESIAIGFCSPLRGRASG